MMITARDKLLLSKVQNYGMLSTVQVNQIFFPGVARTTVLRRLRMLEEAHLLRRLLGLETHEVLWTLTGKGASLIRTAKPRTSWSKNLLEHDHRLVKLRLLMETNGVARSWKPEHEIRSIIFRQNGRRGMQDKLVPDGLMGVEVKGQMESVAVELELTMKSSQRYDQTFRRYAGKENIFAVWYVAPNEGILNLVYRRWKRTQSLYKLPRLYLSLIDEVMRDPLEARLMGEKCVLIRNLWGAHSPAQEVSKGTGSSEEWKAEVRTQDHTPF